MIVVNMHLYGLDVASGGAILPEHDVVIFDEASQITPWDAIGAMARGRQVIIAGDPPEPEGPYSDSLQIIETGACASAGPAKAS